MVVPKLNQSEKDEQKWVCWEGLKSIAQSMEQEIVHSSLIKIKVPQHKDENLIEVYCGTTCFDEWNPFSVLYQAVSRYSNDNETKNTLCNGK